MKRTAYPGYGNPTNQTQASLEIAHLKAQIAELAQTHTQDLANAMMDFQHQKDAAMQQLRDEHAATVNELEGQRDAMETKWRMAEAQQEGVDSEISALMARLQDKDEEVARIKKDAEDQVDAMNRHFATQAATHSQETAQQLEDRQHQINLMHEQVEAAKERTYEAEAELKQQQRLIAEMEETKDQLKAEVEDAKQYAQDYQKYKDAALVKLEQERAAHRDEVDLLRRQFAKQQEGSKVADLLKKNQSLQDKCDEMQTVILSVTEDRDEFDRKFQAANLKRARAEQEVSRITLDIQSLKREKGAIEKQLNTVEAQKAHLEKQQAVLVKRHATDGGRMQELELKNESLHRQLANVNAELEKSQLATMNARVERKTDRETSDATSGVSDANLK